MIGCDIRNMDGEIVSLLMNPEVLAVNQDILGIPAKRVKTIGSNEVWKKPLWDGSTAVALLNRGSVGEDITLNSCEIGLLDGLKLARNLWSQEDIADFKFELTLRVQPHETILLKISQ